METLEYLNVKQRTNKATPHDMAAGLSHVSHISGVSAPLPFCIRLYHYGTPWIRNNALLMT